MKPTTQERIDRLAEAVRKQYPELAGRDIGMMRAVAEQVLKEQDRDTRHACAEAVSSLNLKHYPATTAAIYGLLTDAHQACMNAHAV